MHKEHTSLKGLENVKSYAIVYSKVPLTQFNQFDLLILESDCYNKRDISELKQKGKIILAYLNVGEVETYRSYAVSIPTDWLIAPNQFWKNHHFIDPGKSGWQKLLNKEIIPKIIDKGFHGFLFDSVDMASSYRYPKYQTGMVNLIKSIHRNHPKTIILLNNADFLIEKVTNDIHGLLIEEIFTEMNQNGEIILRNTEVRLSILKKLEKVKKSFNIPIFFVEYFPTNQDLPIENIYKTKDKFGFIPYITDLNAQKVNMDMVDIKKVRRSCGVN